MAIIKLSSTNPKFSHVIMKNPASGMQIKTLRQGFSFGWFKDESEYCVYFKDSDDEISFKEISA